MEHQSTYSPFKQLLIHLITLVFGSFIFVGILENYKNDESLKLKLLENYLEPARKNINSCLRKQNQLIEHYSEYNSAMVQVFKALDMLVNDADLEKNLNYELILRGNADNLNRVKQIHSELPIEVATCRNETYQKLESLSIATGSYEFFKEQSSNRVDRLNNIDKKYREKLKEGNGEITEKEIARLFFEFVKMDMRSDDERRSIVSKFSVLLPVIENYSKASAEAEFEKYDTELKFFESVRENSAMQLNKSFEYGFFRWLI